MKGKVIWFYGNSGAGKTTAADKMSGCVRLDGAIARKRWVKEGRPLGFSAEDRIENNRRIAALAKETADNGTDVVVSTICPYRSLRKEISELIPDITWCEVHSRREHATTEEYPFEAGYIDGAGI